MIELSATDACVIQRLAHSQMLDYLPTAELNDEGQTEVIRWIEGVGKLDDQLSPYAWYSLAEDAALSNDPDEPILVEMLPTYTLSGESEMLELCRMQHFNWSIEDIPVAHIENAEVLADDGVPVRFFLLAEVAGDAFTKHLCDACSDLISHELPLLALSIKAYFLALCESAGVSLDDGVLVSGEEDAHWEGVDETEFNAALEEGIDAGRNAIIFLDPDLDASLPASQDLMEMPCFKILS